MLPARRDEAAEQAKRVAERFSDLYSNPTLDDKARLQKTMQAISDAYAMLKLQWSALGQSPDYGIALLRQVRVRYPQVPFIFYSRKITREDVIRVLQSGAVDAIRKGALKDHEVLARLAAAQDFYCGEDAQKARAHGFNANITLKLENGPKGHDSLNPQFENSRKERRARNYVTSPRLLGFTSTIW